MDLIKRLAPLLAACACVAFPVAAAGQTPTGPMLRCNQGDADACAELGAMFRTGEAWNAI